MTPQENYIKTLEQQLANATKQIAAMRERLLTLVRYAEESNDCQYGTLSTRLVLDIAKEALDATADLAGLVVCDAVPVGHFAQEYMGGPVIYVQVNHSNKDDFGVIPLYEAKEKP